MYPILREIADFRGDKRACLKEFPGLRVHRDIDEFIAAESINDESRGEWLGGMIVATVTLFIVLVGAFIARW